MHDEPTSRTDPDAITGAEAWQLLLDAGVPLLAGTPRRSFADATRLAAALRRVMGDPGSTGAQEREALHAWLCAWRAHWPTSFARHIGQDGTRMIEELAAAGIDPCRYLKLRRIAITHLSRSL